jgi:hypothetical protein
MLCSLDTGKVLPQEISTSSSVFIKLSLNYIITSELSQRGGTSEPGLSKHADCYITLPPSLSRLSK